MKNRKLIFGLIFCILTIAACAYGISLFLIALRLQEQQSIEGLALIVVIPAILIVMCIQFALSVGSIVFNLLCIRREERHVRITAYTAFGLTALCLLITLAFFLAVLL